MSLDTRNKRASAMSLDVPWGRVLPHPDGTISGGDRQQAANKYAGVVVGGGGGGGGGNNTARQRCLTGVGL